MTSAYFTQNISVYHLAFFVNKLFSQTVQMWIIVCALAEFTKTKYLDHLKVHKIHKLNQ